MCEIFEERRQEELLELSKDLEDTNNLHFARYSEVIFYKSILTLLSNRSYLGRERI